MNISRLLMAVFIGSSVIIVTAQLNTNYQVPFLKNPQKIKVENLSELGAYPVKAENIVDPPELTARSATVIDNSTGITLFEKNPNLRHLPASTTKLMTALIALENCLPQTIIKVGFVQKEGTQMGLTEGDSLTVENLLYGLLVSSGNDVAYTISYSCASSYENFISAMNKKAKELGMLSTHFANPAGYDDELQFSTAHDLTKLSRAAVANPLISKIVATRSIVVNDVTGTKTFYLENVNKLLGTVSGIEGVKTGQTEGSLENLVTKTTRDNHTIITVILGSEDRFGESKSLIEWAFNSYRWQNP